MDEKLHDDEMEEAHKSAPLSLRGWVNASVLLTLVLGMFAVFALYPIIGYFVRPPLKTFGAYNVGGINATGQIPSIPGLPTLIDTDTPQTAYTRTGFDGHQYNLVFSDEFNVDGRTFWPGDDPFWEAVDLNYWATHDYEWYDPDAVTTHDGKLVITLTQEPINGFNFRSGMIQSWNKFCFTGGYVEVSAQLPGTGTVTGFWPGVWAMGNLGRAGYGSTTDGTWPYTYNTCDLGTLPNQTNVAGTGPAAALPQAAGGLPLSYLPGQRLSACTCAGEEHPGPNPSVGRGAPEIDVLEAGIGYRNGANEGAVSQSAQFAPFDAQYLFNDQAPATTVYDAVETQMNSYKGGVYQEATSAFTYVPTTAYEGVANPTYSTFGWEAWPDPANGFITWQVNGKPSWQVTSATVAPNAAAGIGQRTISNEPMYLIMNLAIADSFQTVQYSQLPFPAHMRVDYVRVYQRTDANNIGCDPPEMPTAQYIQDHLPAYTNRNFTTWAEAGYAWPKNSMEHTC
ncbi:glycoside hydrolase family 16 protein [Meredithblackwellia eburnea MCA 4105]